MSITPKSTDEVLLLAAKMTLCHGDSPRETWLAWVAYGVMFTLAKKCAEMNGDLAELLAEVDRASSDAILDADIAPGSLS